MNKTQIEDWYPELKIRIDSKKIINVHFDTGSPQSFLSYEYLLENKIINPAVIFIGGIRIGDGSYFHYVKVKLNLSLISSVGETTSIQVPIMAIRDFDKSFLAHQYKNRIGLFGRDILRLFDNYTIEVDYQSKETKILHNNWKIFENDVARAFRKLGVNAKKNISLSGNQIDVYLEEQSISGKLIRTIVECKFYKNPVGVKELKEFSYVFEFAKSNNLCEHGIIVSYSGFTKDAYLIAKTSNIELLEYDELVQKVKNTSLSEEILDFKSYDEPVEKSSDKKEKQKTAFVIMPFKDEFKDIYFLGIREVLSKYDFICIRADELQFNDRIMDKIRAQIKNADIIVCELTEQNPNVYYELGIAHTIDKTVIMCTKDISNTPFDVIEYNHIIYKSIVELREKLSIRIKSII